MKKFFAMLMLLAVVGCGGAANDTEETTPAPTTDMPGESAPADTGDTTDTGEGETTDDPAATTEQPS